MGKSGFTLIPKTVEKISKFLFNVSPRLHSIVSMLFYWVKKHDPIDAYLRKRYLRNPQAFWTREDVIGPLKDAKQRTELLRNQIKVLGAKSVLEVGCCYGSVLKALIGDNNCSITRLAGCDFSTTRLEKAKDFIGNEKVKLAYCDATKLLPYQDNAFDLSFTDSVLQHIAPELLDKALSEMVRVTKRHIVHEEDTVQGSYTFAHDYSSWYEKHGHSLIYQTRDWELSKKQRQFLVIKLRKSDSH